MFSEEELERLLDLTYEAGTAISVGGLPPDKEEERKRLARDIRYWLGEQWADYTDHGYECDCD